MFRRRALAGARVRVRAWRRGTGRDFVGFRWGCRGCHQPPHAAQAMFKGAGANVLRGTGAALVLVLYGEITAAMGIEAGGGDG